MKRQIILLFLLALLLSNKGKCSFISLIQADNDSTLWLRELKEFRNSVYINDKSRIKSYIDFPILNENNEIWYLAYGGNSRKFETIPERIKPFTEKDFDVYYSKIFTKQFIKAFLKVKTQELYSKGKTETAVLTENSTTYSIHATLENKGKILRLTLNSNTISRDEKGEIMDGGEFSVAYFFDILENGKLKFRYVRVAG